MPEILKHCVAAVGKEKGKDAAFAICTASLQKAGILKKGSGKELTAKGKKAEARHKAEPDAAKKSAEYEKVIDRRGPKPREESMRDILKAIEEGCSKPGRKIRSKGKGRGLGIGKGEGPIGRMRDAEEVGEDLEERSDAPSDPVDRAEKRMADAFHRGGWEGLMKDTMRRIKVMTDREKARGLLNVLDSWADDIETLQRQVKAKMSSKSEKGVAWE